MKYLLIAASLMLPITAFAMSCPNNSTIIDSSNTYQDILKLCGKPASENDYIQTINIKQQYVYYIENLDQTNSKVTFLFDHDQITNIAFINGSNGNNAIEQNLNSISMCNQIINAGDTLNKVTSSCGDPDTQTVLQTQSIAIKELTYPVSGINTLVFEDDKLTDWKQK